MDETYMDTVTLTLDNDELLECAILTYLDVDGQRYVALLPLDENGEESDEQVYIYRCQTTGEDEVVIENIEDDDEFERVADKYDEWLDTMEFEEMDLDALE